MEAGYFELEMGLKGDLDKINCKLDRLETMHAMKTCIT